jgi:hypothetical protein
MHICYRIYVGYTSVVSKAKALQILLLLISKWIAFIHELCLSQEYAYAFHMIAKRAINPAPFVMLDSITLTVSEED